MKKKKFKRIRFLQILGVIILFAIIVYLVINIRIKNIYVKGNKLISDQEIIELAGIENYPKLFSISSLKMTNKIKLNKVIKDCYVKKNIFGRVDIEVTEYNMVLKDETTNSIYLSNNSLIAEEEYITGLPSLVNVVEKDVLQNFLKKLDMVDKNILAKISEIEYVPNEYDKDLFLFYMNDGNHIYINTNRLLNINKYESVLEQLEGQKGIIYLDSGNHFEAFE